MTNRPTSESNKTRAARPIAASLLAGVLLTGCQLDSYLDPSVVGRWERTPTVVPILERLAIIEGPEDEFVEYTDVLAEDLIPVPDEYRTSPGDTVRVTAYDLVTRGVPDIYERTIDNRGMVQLPQLGQVYIAGMTSDEARQAIAQSMTRFVANPLVTVEIPAPRKRTFTIFGAVSNPGPYFVPSADYRLLEALNTAGSFGQSVEYIYVIRQKPLTDEVRDVDGVACIQEGAQRGSNARGTSPSLRIDATAPPPDTPRTHLRRPASFAPTTPARASMRRPDYHYEADCRVCGAQLVRPRSSARLSFWRPPVEGVTDDGAATSTSIFDTPGRRPAPPHSTACSTLW